MKAEDAARIDALVETAARALFASHGVPLGERSADFGDGPDGVSPASPGCGHDPSDHDIAACIGFTGAEIRGAISLTTRRDLIARTWPAELRGEEPSERQLGDWAGELVNQLLGRIKNALAAHQLPLEQSTPTVVTGLHVHRVAVVDDPRSKVSLSRRGRALLA